MQWEQKMSSQVKYLPGAAPYAGPDSPYLKSLLSEDQRDRLRDLFPPGPMRRPMTERQVAASLMLQDGSALPPQDAPPTEKNCGTLSQFPTSKPSTPTS